MALLTQAEARAASRSRYGTVLTESALGRATPTPLSTRFDVFLSHSSEDAEIIAGVKALLEREELSVYVDWIDDPQADRSRVTAATADLLRTRMRNSGFLLYASSRASSSSKWMPWELGYFDGHRPGRVGILPVVSAGATGFTGLEYLGLYPRIERIDFQGLGMRFGRYTAVGQGDVLGTLARG